MIDAIMDPESSLESVSLEWIESYQQNQISAVTELINLVLKSSGCEFPVEQHDVEQMESAAQTLAQVQEVAKLHTAADCPINGKKPEFRKFRRKITLFFECLVVNAATKDVLYHDDEFMESISTWIMPMSGSQLRAIRQTSTIILLTIESKLCALRDARNTTEQKQRKIAEDEGKKKRPSNAVITRATDMADQEKEKVRVLSEIINDIFTAVIANRYKDVDSKIRAECVHYLGNLVESSPQYFLSNRYLQYIARASNDVDSAVRLQAVEALLRVYQNADYQTSLRQFTERYLSRFIEMAMQDADQHVRKVIVDLLSFINQMGFLDEESCSKVGSLILDCDPKVRQASAQFLVVHIRQESVSVFDQINSSKVESLRQKYLDFSPVWADYKLVATIMPSILDIGQENSDTTQLFSGSSRRSNLAMNELFVPLPDRLSTAAEAIQKSSRKKLIDDQHDWNWASLAEQLLYDFSKYEKARAAAVDRQFVALFSLDQSEELIMLDIIHGFIAAAINHALELENKRKRSRIKEEEDGPGHESVENIYESLTEILPKLLDKFRYSPVATSKLLRIQSLVGIDMYRKLRKERELETIFEDVVKQFIEQSSPAVLSECSRIFNIAVSSNFYADTARQTLEQTLDDLSFDLRERLVEVLDVGGADVSGMEDKYELVGSLSKFEFLSRAINIRSFIEGPVGKESMDLNSGQALIRTLDDINGRFSSDEHLDQTLEYNEIVFSILRSYAIWKLSDLTQLDRLTSIEQVSELLQDIIKTFTALSSFSLGRRENDHRAMLKSLPRLERYYSNLKGLLLDILIAVKISKKQASIDSLAYQVLSSVSHDMSPKCEKEIMALLFAKERKYAQAVHEKLETNLIDRQVDVVGDRIVENEEDDDEAENMDDYDEILDRQEDENVIVTSDEILELDYDLCRFAAKINLAVVANLISSEYGKRLSLNNKVLSPRFVRVVRTGIEGVNGPQPSNKRARA